MEPILQPLAPQLESSDGVRRGAPLELVRGVPFFADLPDDQLRAIASVMWTKAFAAGEAMYQQGGEPDGLYVLETGDAQMWTRIGDTRKDLVRFKAGESLCGTGLVEGGLRLSSCDAISATNVWVLDAKSFQGFCSGRQRAAFNALSAVAAGQSKALMGTLSMMRSMLGVVSKPERGAASEAPVGRPPTAADEPMLRVLPFLRQASPEVFASLRASSTFYEAKRGQKLLAEGARAGSMSVVVRGAVEASVAAEQGKFRVALRGPGRWIGHEALLGKMLQPVDQVAKENSVLLAFSEEQINALCEARTELGLMLLKQVALEFVAQFTFDHRELLRQVNERGLQMSMSSDEILALSDKAST